MDVNGCNRMILDVAILYSINEINGLTIELDIYAREIG